jgi:predicted DCC family thiol-disulfide oxidoreductase YuxK
MNDHTSTDSVAPACSSVFFDGSCPLCRREIAVYQHLKADLPIDWIDITQADFVAPAGQSVDGLMKRFHVTTPSGDLLSGAQAFVHIWSQLPGWRWLARLARLPGMLALMELSYRGFLRIRPRMQRLARRLD